MLVYEKIDISDGINVGMSDKSKECMLCHYWYFLDKSFSYGPYLCDGCYNMMQKCNKLKNIAIVHNKESVYRICFLYMSKHEAKNLKTNLIDKKGGFFSLYKMDNTTYYQRNREIMLNRAKNYYENDKERLREKARNKYRYLPEKDKKKKREYGKNIYHNMSEEKKQELKEYQKQRYREAKGSKNNNA